MLRVITLQFVSEGFGGPIYSFLAVHCLVVVSPDRAELRLAELRLLKVR